MKDNSFLVAPKVYMKVVSLVACPTGKLIGLVVTGLRDRFTIMLYSITTAGVRTSILRCQDHWSSVSLKFTADGHHLLAKGTRLNLYWLEVSNITMQTFEIATTQNLGPDIILARIDQATLIPASRGKGVDLLAYSPRDCTLRMYNVQTGKVTDTCTIGYQLQSRLSISCSDDGRLAALASQQSVTTFQTRPLRVLQKCYASDIARTMSNGIFLPGTLTFILGTHTWTGMTSRIMIDGRVVSIKRQIVSWDWTSENPRAYTTSSDLFYLLSFAMDGRDLVLSQNGAVAATRRLDDSVLSTIELSNQRVLWNLNVAPRIAQGVSFANPTGEYVYVPTRERGSSQQSLNLYAIGDDTPILQIDEHGVLSSTRLDALQRFAAT